MTTPSNRFLAHSALSRRSVLQIAGLGLVAAGVAGCAPSVSGGGEAEGLTDDGVKQFDFTSWSMNEEASKAQLEKLLDSWSESAGVTIETPSYPFNEFLKQVILQLRGGQLAGAMQMDIAWLTSTASLGKFADVSSLTDGVGYADYALPTGQHGGVQVGFPWTTGAIGMVANRELMEEVGVTEPPTTIEDFEAMLVELKGLGGGVVPYAAMTKVANLKDIVPWMWAFGSPVVEDGEITIGDDESIDAITWYKKVYDDGLIGKDLDRYDARALFGQGKVGVFEDAPAARKFVSANATDPDIGDKLTAFGRPVVNSGDDPQALSWGQLICVANGEGAYAAAEFAKHITSDKETVLGYFEEAGYPPALTEALDDPRFTSDTFAAEFATRITPTAQADPIWEFSQSALMYEALAAQVQAVLIGKSSPKEAAQQAKSDMDKLKD